MEPDHVPFMSKDFEGNMAFGRASQLMRSLETECAHTMFPHTEPLGLYW